MSDLSDYFPQSELTIYLQVGHPTCVDVDVIDRCDDIEEVIAVPLRILFFMCKLIRPLTLRLSSAARAIS